MIILSIRTDKPEAEIGLFDGSRQLVYETWTAHRQLAETLHSKIEQLLQGQNKSWPDLEGIVSYSYQLPIAAEQDPRWLENGLQRLQNGERDKLALPYYGADAHITLPKK
jgi:hypothetical protein